ncbi:MAG: NGG1p interacting factor NIF3 [Elusimicrobia bacterium]|nr:NGG1p interacting factor NIF3 [Elusimicrobiota bacterium]
MKLKEFYNFVVEEGILSDPRGVEQVKKGLSVSKQKYDKLDNEKKSEFDMEILKNPYTDTRILNGSGEEEIKSMLVGIDIDTAEIVLAEYLKKSGKRIDLALSHHPSGYAYANFYEVMGMQSEILEKFGVSINVAEGLLSKRIKEVAHRVMPVNHTKSGDAAKLLGIPFMCAHTVADNHVAKYLQEKFDSVKPYFVSDVVKTLKTIPEYKNAVTETVGPKILVGNEENRAGKVFVDMTGGTEGAVEFLEKLSIAGVGTIVAMHMSEKHIKKAEKSNINIVVAGHISSDNLGLNLLFDKVENRFGSVDFIPCSGFRRIKHNQ